MSDPFSDLVKQLSSKGDWAVVLPAAIVGYIADAVIYAASVPVISASMCGVLAGGAALSVKRGVEALSQRRANHERVGRARDEAAHLAIDLERANKTTISDELRFETAMTDNVEMLIAAIRRARAKL